MKKILKWVGVVLGAVVSVALVAGIVLYMVGGHNIAAAHGVSAGELVIPTDSASLAHGAHLTYIFGCRDCHGSELSGDLMGDEAPFRLEAPNLTPAGLAAGFSPSDWDRAIRHGVRPDGTALFVMPSGAYNKLSDSDTAALIAFLQTLAPVESEHGSIVWKPIGRMLAAGPIDLAKFVHTTANGPATSPTPDSTSAYGEYVVGMMCSYCHGPNVEGQIAEGSEILAPDLRAAAGWTREQFHHALTTGERPVGSKLDPEVMPWTATAQMTETERESIRQYLIELAERG